MRKWPCCQSSIGAHFEPRQSSEFRVELTLDSSQAKDLRRLSANCQAPKDGPIAGLVPSCFYRQQVWFGLWVVSEQAQTRQRRVLEQAQTQRPAPSGHKRAATERACL